MANYTDNYQLHQWEAGDDFLRTDFNEDFQKIDAALGTIPKIAAGSYRGTGTHGTLETKQLEIGFAARLVLIMRDDYNSQLSGLFLRPCQHGLGGFDNNSNPILTWTDTGVSWTANGNSMAAGLLNDKDVTYRWWAIG